MSGTPWEKGRFDIVTRTTEMFPGFFFLAVVVGCSHPGVEKILEEAVKIEPRLFAVAGGFHLVLTPWEEIERVAGVIQDSFEVERVAPGHCTSELGFAVRLDRFKDRFDRAGLGTVISLP